MTKKPKLAEYWSTDILKSIPWFSSVFSHNRFEAIFHTCMHASEVDAAGKAKIQPFVDRLVSNFQRAFYPYKNLSIHETVIGSEGRFAAKQYNPNKPEKHHIKTFGLCDSLTGYCHNLFIYFGADTSYNPDTDPNAQEAVKDSIKSYFDKNCGSITQEWVEYRKLSSFNFGERTNNRLESFFKHLKEQVDRNNSLAELFISLLDHCKFLRSEREHFFIDASSKIPVDRSIHPNLKEYYSILTPEAYNIVEKEFLYVPFFFFKRSPMQTYVFR